MIRKNVMLKVIGFVVLILICNWVYSLTSPINASDTKATIPGTEKSAEDKYKKISYEDLKKGIEEKTIALFDCNGSESYAKGHIPSAVDAKAKDWETKLPQNKDALIVVYCASEKCPAWKVGAARAAELGYTNIQRFSGGLQGWKEAGGELVK